MPRTASDGSMNSTAVSLLSTCIVLLFDSGFKALSGHNDWEARRLKLHCPLKPLTSEVFLHEFRLTLVLRLADLQRFDREWKLAPLWTDPYVRQPNARVHSQMR